jgi:hypothetical protein
MTRFVLGAAVLALMTVTTGCSDPPLRLNTIQVGRSLNEDASIASPTTAFTPKDTIYVSVLTGARGASTIGVRWYFGSQMLSEREKQASFNGPGATEFNLQSAAGFPVGDYSVEVLIDGESVGRRVFTVSN